MSGTAIDNDDLDQKLATQSKRLQLMETERKIRVYESLEKRRQKLTESWESSDPVNVFADATGSFRANGDDYLGMISTAADRRYGDFWPFWRTWIEHARLRWASRLLFTTSPLVQGAISAVGAYVVGEGFQHRAATRHDDAPKPLVECAQSWLDDWVEENDWNAVQLECWNRHQRDGEYFLQLFPSEDGYTLTRAIEPAHVLDAHNVPMESGKYGVVTDPEDLWDVRGFWVCLDGNAGNGKLVPSSQMKIHKANVDYGVKRGLPTIAYDTADLFRIATRLLENLGTGAAIQAAIAFVRQHEIAPGSAVSEFVAGMEDYTQTRAFGGRRETVSKFEAGTVVDMDAGQKFVPTDFAANVQNFTSAVQAMLRACAVFWNAPEWITSSDASNNSYSSSLTAEAPFVKRCKQRQAEFKHVFGWAVRSAFRTYVRKKNGLKAGGSRYSPEAVFHYLDVETTPPTVETRNRQEESTLNKTYMDMGVKSPQTIAQEQNLDYDREQLNLKEHKKNNPDPNQQQQPGGGGGMPGMMGGGGGEGEGEDPTAALAGMAGGPGEGAAEESQGQGGEIDFAEEDAGGEDDVLSDAGLDGLFDGLGLPEDGGEEVASAEVDPQAFKAVLDLQKSVYGDTVPTAAAKASVRLLGLDDGRAGELFPDVSPEPDARHDSPVDDVMGVVEAVIVGKDRAGRRYAFDTDLHKRVPVPGSGEDQGGGDRASSSQTKEKLAAVAKDPTHLWHAMRRLDELKPGKGGMGAVGRRYQNVVKILRALPEAPPEDATADDVSRVVVLDLKGHRRKGGGEDLHDVLKSLPKVRGFSSSRHAAYLVPAGGDVEAVLQGLRLHDPGVSVGTLDDADPDGLFDHSSAPTQVAVEDVPAQARGSGDEHFDPDGVVRYKRFGKGLYLKKDPDVGGVELVPADEVPELAGLGRDAVRFASQTDAEREYKAKRREYEDNNAAGWEDWYNPEPAPPPKRGGRPADADAATEKARRRAAEKAGRGVSGAGGVSAADPAKSLAGRRARRAARVATRELAASYDLPGDVAEALDALDEDYSDADAVLAAADDLRYYAKDVASRGVGMDDEGDRDERLAAAAALKVSRLLRATLTESVLPEGVIDVLESL